MISKMWLIGTSFFVGVIAFNCSRIWAQDSAEPGFHASLDAEFRYGNIDGFVQIPRGGGAGTTSGERPTFAEIGINHAAIGAPAVALGWNNHNIYGIARIIRLSGSDVLSETLISNGTTFPAGSHVNADVRLDWYGLGYDYRFAYKYNSAGSLVSFYPAVGFALLNFDYNLNGTPGLSASRGFAKAAPQLGLKSEWVPGGPFSLSAGILSSLPFSNLPLLLSVNFTAGYQIWAAMITAEWRTWESGMTGSTKKINKKFRIISKPALVRRWSSA